LFVCLSVCLFVCDIGMVFMFSKMAGVIVMKLSDAIDIESQITRNLAIANRSRISCAYNASRESIITPLF